MNACSFGCARSQSRPSDRITAKRPARAWRWSRKAAPNSSSSLLLGSCSNGAQLFRVLHNESSCSSGNLNRFVSASLQRIGVFISHCRRDCSFSRVRSRNSVGRSGFHIVLPSAATVSFQNARSKIRCPPEKNQLFLRTCDATFRPFAPYC